MSLSSIGIAVIAGLFGVLSVIKTKKKIPNWLFIVLSIITLLLVVYKEFDDSLTKVRTEYERKEELSKLKEDLSRNFDSSLIKYGLRYNGQTQEVYQIQKLVKEVMSKKELDEVNIAIENLLNPDDEKAVLAADFLKGYFDKKQLSGFELSDKQLINLNKVFVYRPNTYMTNKTLPLLFFKENEYATSYCKRILKGEIMGGDDNFIMETAKYLNKIDDIKYFLPFITSYIKMDPINNWRFIVSACIYLSEENFTVIVNSEEILNSIRSVDYQLVIDNLSFALYDLKKKEVFKNSLLQQRASFNK